MALILHYAGEEQDKIESMAIIGLCIQDTVYLMQCVYLFKDHLLFFIIGVSFFMESIDVVVIEMGKYLAANISSDTFADRDKKC